MFVSDPNSGSASFSEDNQMMFPIKPAILVNAKNKGVKMMNASLRLRYLTTMSNTTSAVIAYVELNTML